MMIAHNSDIASLRSSWGAEKRAGFIIPSQDLSCNLDELSIDELQALLRQSNERLEGLRYDEGGRLFYRGRARSGSITPVRVTTGVINPDELIKPIWATDNIVQGVAALDYLTLTTYNPLAHATAVKVLVEHTDAGAIKGGKDMQYTGILSPHWFAGTGQQRGQEHYMVRVSGIVAHEFFNALEAANKPQLISWNCTRADVQYTHFENAPGKLEDLYNHLLDEKWIARRGPKPYLEIYQNSKGLDTLGVGTRKETIRYQRMYIKLIGDEKLLRYETEFKQELSRQLWDRICTEGVGILNNILSSEISALPLPDSYTFLLVALNAPPERMKVVKEKSTDATTQKYIMQSILPFFRRLQSKGAEWTRFIANFCCIVMYGEDPRKEPWRGLEYTTEELLVWGAGVC